MADIMTKLAEMRFGKSAILRSREAESAENEFFANVVAIADNLGFDYCAYAARLPPQAGDPQAVMRSNYPRSWQDRYLKMGYIEVDPAVRQALRSPEHLLWSEELFAGTELFRQEAKSCGINYGWSKATYDPRGVASVFTLARSCEPIAGDELLAKLPQMLWLTQIAHLGLTLCLLERNVFDVQEQLSPREAEILGLSAEGLTAIDICVRMGISERTVNFHINNAIVKLGARNKTHAVVKAIQLGQI